MMKRILSIVSTVTVSIALCASTSFAAGFRLPETSNSAMGMASAFVGQADDASAVWYNPAGITQLKGTQIMGGVVAVAPYVSHDTATTTEVSERDIHLPVHFFATHKMNDQMSFGLGINNPFGLATDWDPQTSVTRNIATFSKVVTTEVNPNVAYKLNDNLSVAAGIAFVHLRATLENISVISTNVRLAGDGDGWGANAALHYKAAPNLNVGLSYRSRVKVEVEDGDIFIGGVGSSSDAKTSITLPDIVTLGTSYKATDNLTINADLDYTMWSTYDRLVIESSVLNNTQEKQWEDSLCFRIGGQYKLSDQWKVRGGYLYDNNPVKEKYFETRVPDSDRQGLSAGVGFSSGPLTVDAAYLYLRFNDRTINDSSVDDPSTVLNGNYKSLANLLGVSVSYKF